jgi:small GTP-binding protein
MEYAYKIIIAGDGGVGKTTLLKRLTTDQYDPQNMTLGLNHEEFRMTEGDDDIHLVSWDLGGQEQFQQLHFMYVKGTHGYLFAYDCTRPKTLWNIPIWMELLRGGDPQIDQKPKVLIGTKGDLGSEVMEESIAEFLDQEHFESHYLTSAKTGENVHELFEAFGRLVHRFYLEHPDLL